MFRTAALALTASLVVACNGASPAPHGGGDRPLGGLHDAGGSSYDAGGGSHNDAGTAGRDAGTVVPHDAGTTPPPPPPGCAPDVVPAPTTAACTAATLTCLEACTDDACADTCLAAAPACDDCLDLSYVSCANTAGCQTQWNTFICCIDACPDPDSAACVTSCASQEAAYETCASAVTTCDYAGDVCFPPGSFSG